MKNNIAKPFPTRTYNASPRLTHEFKRKLKGQIKWLFVNKEFIEFIEATLKKLSQKDKEACLYYFMKLAIQERRAPDLEHFKAHEDIYCEEMSKIVDEQMFYDPIKWITAELEYLKSTSEMPVNDNLQKLEEQKASESLFDQELVPEKTAIKILGMSKSKLLRLRAEGMPYRKIGKPIYYNLTKVKEWLTSEAA